MQEHHAGDVEVEDLGILPTYYEAAYKAGQAIDRASGKGLPDRAILCSSRGQVRRVRNCYRQYELGPRAEFWNWGARLLCIE